jgi:predicted ester cyclase
MARVYAMNVQEQIERTRQVIHRYFSEVWNEGRLQVLDELVTLDYIHHSPSTPDPERGPRGLKPIVAAMRIGIPDLHYTILDAVLEPDKEAVHVRLTGTPTGESFGMAPTNRSIDVRQMQIEWLRDGGSASTGGLRRSSICCVNSASTVRRDRAIRCIQRLDSLRAVPHQPRAASQRYSARFGATTLSMGHRRFCLRRDRRWRAFEPTVAVPDMFARHS